MKTLTRFALALIMAGALIHAAQRFDMSVRGDFFAGFAGNQAALDRAMKTCEDQLAENPKHAEAMVWHGSGTMFIAGQAFRKGDYAAGGQLWGQALKEMDNAVSLDPENVAVLIPRGATLLSASGNVPPELVSLFSTKALAITKKYARSSSRSSISCPATRAVNCYSAWRTVITGWTVKTKLGPPFRPCLPSAKAPGMKTMLSSILRVAFIRKLP